MSDGEFNEYGYKGTLRLNYDKEQAAHVKRQKTLDKIISRGNPFYWSLGRGKHEAVRDTSDESKAGA